MKISKRLAEIKAGKTWHFHGGIHPAEHKKETSGIPVEKLPLPKILVVPLKQHSGQPGELLVKAGDQVKKGQPLTLACNRYQLPVHAPTSGTVQSVGPYHSCQPSGLPEDAVIIIPDGKDEWAELNTITNYQNAPVEDLIAQINQSGIVGMGGAGFPTGSKIRSALDKTRILIINGSECEPYLTCDDRLMQEHAEEIVTGVRILQKIYEPEITIIAVENNKPQAVKALKTALIGLEDSIFLRILPVLYPTGAARPLIKILTGIEVGYDHRSNDFGITMHNVASTYAVKRAVINGEPLIERIVTISGGNFARNGNVMVRNGTLVRHILNNFHLINNHELSIILGGPMMGFNIDSPDVPLTKTINCIIAPADGELPLRHSYLNCIKCGKCQEVCPSYLVPYALLSHSRACNFEDLEKEHIKDCIECGCCTYVCSSNIPLVQEFRIAKASMKKIQAEEKFKKSTKDLIAFREMRLEHEKLEREARINALKKKASQQTESSAGNKPVLPSADPAALAKARALALAKARAQSSSIAPQVNEASENPSAADPKALALAKAKALALAKAKAQLSSAAPQGNEASEKPSAADPKALALAKAKALALAKTKAQSSSAAPQGNEASANSSAAEPKALALAKAKALALAKAKAAQQHRNSED